MVILVILVAAAVTAGTFMYIGKRSADLAALSAARARYAHLVSSDSRVSYAIGQLQKATTSYDETAAKGVEASQSRHKLWSDEPYDLADALTAVRSEKEDVQQLGGLSQTKASAARTAAAAVGTYFGDTVQTEILGEITSASEAELKYLADWGRATEAVDDTLTSTVNGRWAFRSPDEIESLYRGADEERATSVSRWTGVISRLVELQGRLHSQLLASNVSDDSAEVSGVRASSSAETPTDTAVPQPPTPASHTMTPVLAKAVATPPAADSSQPLGPLSRENVLPLLRSTPAISVSSDVNGHTAYVTVPDTPANGTADANRIISGQLADGRWVVFVPLASGNQNTGDIYSLMWVWTNGRAQFVGEIPAENNGLGRLATSVRDGEIYISWPLCCPRETRTKVLTLDGIRLRPVSDTTS